MWAVWFSIYCGTGAETGKGEQAPRDPVTQCGITMYTAQDTGAGMHML